MSNEHNQNDTASNQNEQPANAETENSASNAAESIPEQGQIDYLGEIQKYKNNWMLAAAEAQNIKRRAEQDIQKAKFFSIERFAKDLIEVLESLYRASENIKDEDLANNPSLVTAKEGIEITKKEMINVFQRNAVTRIYPKGELFDPNFHEAISQLETGQPAGTIIDVVRAGYILKDRLLQAALVVVAK